MALVFVTHKYGHKPRTPRLSHQRARKQAHTHTRVSHMPPTPPPLRTSPDQIDKRAALVKLMKASPYPRPSLTHAPCLLPLPLRTCPTNKQTGNLVKLGILDCHNNLLATVPDGLGHCQRLERLYLSVCANTSPSSAPATRIVLPIFRSLFGHTMPGLLALVRQPFMVWKTIPNAETRTKMRSCGRD